VKEFPSGRDVYSNLTSELFSYKSPVYVDETTGTPEIEPMMKIQLGFIIGSINP
jgi:hypothetical protein